LQPRRRSNFSTARFKPSAPSWIRSRKNAEATIALGDRDDEAQVRIDHLLLGSEVVTLDPLGECHLLGGAQQPVAADLGEEELDPAFCPGGGELLELLLPRHSSSDAPA
jgi:hypothetical protein